MDDPSTYERRFMCAALLLVALAPVGCSGGIGSMPMSAVAPALHGGATADAAGKTVPVAVRLQWPVAHSTAEHSRGPAFVSPSAASAIVTVRNGKATVVAFQNAPGTAHSVLHVNAPVGNDDFTIALYDKPQSGTANPPTGHILGDVSLLQQVSAGAKNVVRATVDGFVHSVSVSVEPNSFVEGSNGRYAIVGQHGAVFVVTPLDVDGNAIVPPGVTPSVTLRAAQQNAYYTVLPGSGTHFTVVVDAAAPSGAKPQFVASATDVRNHTVSSRFIVAQRAEVYVAYASGGVLAFDDAGTPLTLPERAFAGLQRPVSLAYDSNDQTVFVADESTGEIHAFTVDGAPLSGFTAPSLAGVTSVAWDSNPGMDEIVAVSSQSGIIANSRTGGREGDTAVISPFTLPAPATGVVYVPPTRTASDTLLVSDTTNGALDFYTPYGAAAPFDTPISVGPPAGTPGALAVDPGATVAWVSGNVGRSGELWRLPLTPSSPSETSFADANAPAGIAYDPNVNRLFVAESTAGTVAAYKSDLSAVDPKLVLTAPASAGVSTPQGVGVAY